jgi:general secretion pathway protein G
MLVLAILAVLTAVVAYNMAGGASKAKIRGTITSMATIKNALDSYNLDYNSYPAVLIALQQGAKPILDPTKPLRDGFDREFFYSPQPFESYPYQLISSGEDGQAGTADDINVWTMNFKKP